MKRNDVEWSYKPGIIALEKDDLHIFLEPAIKCPWHKTLPFYINSSASNFLDHWKIWWDRFKNKEASLEDLQEEFEPAGGNWKGAKQTAKKCPGILGILNKSYIVKSPCEIHIHVENGQIQALHKSDPNAVQLDMHPSGQYLSPGSDVLRNKQSLKISLPVNLRTKLPYIFLNPTYHKDTGLEVIPGVIEGKWVDHVALIVHTMVDTSVDRYIHIKPGDPIAYAWFPEKTTLKHNPNMKDRRTMRFFNKPVDFIPKKK